MAFFSRWRFKWFLLVNTPQKVKNENFKKNYSFFWKKAWAKFDNFGLEGVWEGNKD